MRWLRSWWKQEQRQLPALASTRRLTVLVMALAVLLGGLELRRRWSEELQRRDQRLTQSTEVLQAGLHTLKGTIYDWAHWDETDAFARGEAPEYFQRNLQISTGLMALVPVVAVFDRQGQPLGVLGRSGPFSWAADPLLRCAREQVPLSLQEPEAVLLLCSDASQRWWMAALEGITDSTETSPVSGVILLAAPLQHPHFGGELQGAMADLEAQLQVQSASAGPSERSLRTLGGEPMRGPGGTLVFIQPNPLAPQVVLSLLADLPLVGVLAVALLTLRIRLVLARRHQQLLEARHQKGVRQRLRQARRRLDRLCPQTSERQASSSADLLDSLTRRLELYDRTIGWLSLRDAASGLPNRRAWLDQLRFMEGQAQPFKLWLLLWPAAADLAPSDLQAVVVRWNAILPAGLFGARVSADRLAWLGPAAVDGAVLAQDLQRLDGSWLLMERALPSVVPDLELWLQSQERLLQRWFTQGQRGWQPQLQPDLPLVSGHSELSADWATALHLNQLEAGALWIRDGRQQISGLALFPLWPAAPLPGLDPPRLRRLAAEQGLATALLLRLLRQGLQAWRSLPPSSRQALELTLPLDLQALQDPTLPAQIQAALHESGCPPELITLAYREADLQASQRSDPLTLESLHQLRAQGLAIQLVGCGTDPASLLLQNALLPLDAVQLSPSLSAAMPFDPAAAALVEALIRLASSRGLRVGVEAVRSIEQHDRLVALGVERFQERFADAAEHSLSRVLESC